MKNILLSSIFAAIFGITVLYTYGTNGDYIHLDATNIVTLMNDDYINIKQLDDTTYMVYCPGDTIYVSVNEYQDETWELSIALDKLNCKL